MCELSLSSCFVRILSCDINILTLKSCWGHLFRWSYWAPFKITDPGYLFTRIWEIIVAIYLCSILCHSHSFFLDFIHKCQICVHTMMFPEYNLFIPLSSIYVWLHYLRSFFPAQKTLSARFILFLDLKLYLYNLFSCPSPMNLFVFLIWSLHLGWTYL